jgi:lambda repressor-like predicted transcriptional regulator
LVRIDGARVRAAIEWEGLSVNAAAQRLGISQQTLDSIVRGKTKRCYASLRDALAQLLGRPAEWIGGETLLQPALTSWLPLPDLGYTPPLWVDENMRIIRPSPEGGYTQAAALPPRYQLAAHDLSTGIIKAWKRDIGRNSSEAQAAVARLAAGRWKKNPWERVGMLIARLISSFWWRRAFLANPKVGDQNADDEFAVSAASALTAVLEPWFKGQQELDYDWLVSVLEWASAGFGKHPSPGGI